MPLSARAFLHRLLQHVLSGGFQRVRQYGVLSRRSKVDLTDLRRVILKSLADVEPDLELQAWAPPVLRPRAENDGPLCPYFGALLQFEFFERIRPPPLWLSRPARIDTFISFTTL